MTRKTIQVVILAALAASFYLLAFGADHANVALAAGIFFAVGALAELVLWFRLFSRRPNRH